MMLGLVAACVPPPINDPRVTEQPVIEQPRVAEPPAEPVEPPTPPEPEPEEQAIAHPLDREPGITVADDPRTLVAQAKGVPAEQAVPLLLRAIAGFIGQGQAADAQALIAQLQYTPMRGFQRHALMLHQAHLAQTLGQHERALEQLRALEQAPAPAPILNAETEARLLWLRADSRQALGRSDEAVATLLRRDALPELPARAANQQRVLELIESLDPLGRLLLREHPADHAIHGWVALSEALQAESPEERTEAIRRWLARYRQHPAAQLLFTQQLPADDNPRSRYRHIAMLLPLTSPFGTAARAFYEGFMDARNHDPADRQPAVSLYDIGEDPSLVSLYHRAAINDGADFIVGPLGRRAVEALLSGAPTQLPVLMIGTVPEHKTAPNLYGLSLSAEREARQVAVRAFADGHRQAGIFRSESLWGRRVADAFAAQWETLGGTLVDDRAFPGDFSEYARVIRKFLGLDKSIKRERLLRAQLKINLQFTPRRRDDLDFLFLAANAEQARLLVPQLRFFQAHDLALYATSYVYNGKPEPAVDADLDGIIFGDMNWILDAAVLPEPEAEAEAKSGTELEPEPGFGLELELELELEPELEFGLEPDLILVPPPEPGTELQPVPDAEADVQAQTQIAVAPESPESVESVKSAEPAESPPPPPGREPGPYYHTDLDRLYALGLESYRVIPALAALRSDPWRRYFGEAVDLGVEADGNVLRHLTWARFARGLPVPLPPSETTVDFSAPSRAPLIPLPVPLFPRPTAPVAPGP